MNMKNISSLIFVLWGVFYMIMAFLIFQNLTFVNADYIAGMILNALMWSILFLGGVFFCISYGLAKNSLLAKYLAWLCLLIGLISPLFSLNLLSLGSSVFSLIAGAALYSEHRSNRH